MKNIFYCLLFSLFLGTNLDAQREIYFLHGNGGTAEAWSNYDALYSPRAGVSTTRRIEYTSSGGFGVAANTARTALNAAGGTSATPNANIGWAHSMGGLTLRKMELDGNANDIGGYIFSGSPHQGAKIANSFADGSIAAFLGEGCNRVVVNPIAATIGFLAANSDLTNSLQDLGNQFLCDGALMDFMSSAGGPFTGPATIADLSVGSDALAELNASLPTKPIITLFGTENSPVHWNWFNNLIPGRQPSGFGFENNATIDNAPTSLPNIMTAVENLELTVSDLAQTISVLAASLPFGIGSDYIAPANEARVAFLSGANWLANSEAEWHVLTGATEITSSTVTTSTELTAYCYFEIFGAPDFNEPGAGWSWYDALCDEECGELFCCPGQEACWQDVTVTTSTTVIMTTSDAVVITENAQLPGICALNIAGANHQELVNHPNATFRYDEILNGTTVCADATSASFFITE